MVHYIDIKTTLISALPPSIIVSRGILINAQGVYLNIYSMSTPMDTYLSGTYENLASRVQYVVHDNLNINIVFIATMKFQKYIQLFKFG